MKMLSESAIKTLAGEGAFERGRGYYNEGRVGPLSIKQSRITAQVSGTQQYSVVLRHTSKVFEGHCNCPASDNFDFCKHCVAVSLSYYYQTQTNQELSEQASESQVHGYLSTLTKPQLVEHLHELLLRDSATMDHWQLKAQIASGGIEPKEIRKRITKAIPYKPGGLWRYRDVADYFDASALTLSGLHEALISLKPQDAIKLVSYAAQRLEKTLQTIDDSGGYRFQTEEQIQAWFKAVIFSSQWSDKERATTLVKLLTDQNLEYAAIEPVAILQELNEDTLSVVYKAVEKEFADLSPQADHYSDQYYYYARIERILLNRARHLGDIENEFRIQEKGAVTVAKCLDLVSLCIRHMRLEEANKWLAHANELSDTSGYHIHNIESVQIELYKAQGDLQQAFDLQWARFEEREDLNTLSPALLTAKALDQHDSCLANAISSIADKLTSDRHKPNNQRRAGNLVGIYLEFGELESAYELSDRYLMQVEHLIAIVNASEKFSEQTYGLLERVVNSTVQHATNPAYDQAVTFLKKQYQKISNTERFHKSVRQIYDLPQNKRKINFIKRLKKAFPLVF